MNESLAFFLGHQRVGSISAYSPLAQLPENYPHDVYKALRSSSHGWGTWRDRWENIDWQIQDYNEFSRSAIDKWRFNRYGSDRVDRLRRQMLNQIDSWSIRFGYSLFRRGQYTVYPALNRIRNIGNDGTGVHVARGTAYNDALAPGDREFCLSDPPPDRRIRKYFRRHYSGSLASRCVRYLRNSRIGMYVHTGIKRLAG